MRVIRRLLLLPPRLKDLPNLPPRGTLPPELVEAQRQLEVHQNEVARAFLDTRVTAWRRRQEGGGD